MEKLVTTKGYPTVQIEGSRQVHTLQLLNQFKEGNNMSNPLFVAICTVTACRDDCTYYIISSAIYLWITDSIDMVKLRLIDLM